jgi:error-prone DNA polymerase
MINRGKIEHFGGVTNLVADRLEPLSSVFPEAGDILPSRHSSRDFR